MRLETFPDKITLGTDCFPYNQVLGAEESYWLGVQSSRTALAVPGGTVQGRRSRYKSHGKSEIKIKIKIYSAFQNKTPRSRQTRRRQTGRSRPPTHPLAHYPARRPQPAAAAAIRGWPGNHGGPRAVEEGMHCPRAQPPQRATHLHPRRRAQVLD